MRNYICLYDFHTLLVQIHGHMGGQVYHGPMGRAQGARPRARGPGPAAGVGGGWGVGGAAAGPGPRARPMGPCMVNLPTHVAMYLHKQGMEMI